MANCSTRGTTANTDEEITRHTNPRANSRRYRAMYGRSRRTGVTFLSINRRPIQGATGSGARPLDPFQFRPDSQGRFTTMKATRSIHIGAAFLYAVLCRPLGRARAVRRDAVSRSGHRRDVSHRSRAGVLEPDARPDRGQHAVRPGRHGDQRHQRSGHHRPSTSPSCGWCCGRRASTNSASTICR